MFFFLNADLLLVTRWQHIIKYLKVYYTYLKSSCLTDHPPCCLKKKKLFNWSINYFALHRRAAVKSRIPRLVLSPVQQPGPDAFSNKRPMTATYRADSPTSPSGSANNKIEHTSTRSVYVAAIVLYIILNTRRFRTVWRGVI